MAKVKPPASMAAKELREQVVELTGQSDLAAMAALVEMHSDASPPPEAARELKKARAEVSALWAACGPVERDLVRQAAAAWLWVQEETSAAVERGVNPGKVAPVVTSTAVYGAAMRLVRTAVAHLRGAEDGIVFVALGTNSFYSDEAALLVASQVVELAKSVVSTAPSPTHKTGGFGRSREERARSGLVRKS